MTFSTQVGGAVSQQTVNVGTPAGVSTGVFFLANITEQNATNVLWLRFPGGVQNTTSTTPAALTLLADPTGLSAGTYNATLTINPSPYAMVNIPVTFTVSAIGVSPTSLSITYQTGSSLPAATNLALSGANISFTAAASTTSGGNWLDVAPTTGSLSGGLASVAVTLDPTVAPTLAAGNYSGAVTITPTSGGSNTPVVVPVSLTITVPPPVSVSSSTLQLNYQLGGSNNSPQQILNISTTSSQALTFGLTATVANNPAGRNWIVINPSSGSIPANGSVPVTVSYDTTANLPAGTWTGTVTLFTPGASPAQQNITVNLLVSNSPLLSVPNGGLSFTYELNSGVTPTAQSVVVTSTNAAAGAATGQIPVTAAASTSSGGGWLAVNPVTGSTGSASPFSVSVNPTGLVPGKYQGTITFTGTGAGNGPQTMPVTLTVASDPSLITNFTAPTGLNFQSQIGQNPVSTTQTSQVVTVNSSTGAALNYVATAATTPSGGSWLVLSGNTTASTSNSFTVSVVPTGLAAGKYTGTVTITATNPASGNAAVNSPLTIPVTFYVSNTSLLVVNLPGNPPSQPVLTAPVNGGPTATQPITLSSTDGTVLNYSATFTSNLGGNWLLFNPSGSTAPGNNTLQISANPGLLSPGTYTGTLTITVTGGSVANSPYLIPITFQVTSGTIQASPTSLQFTQTAGGAAPATQTVQLTSSGPALNYQAVANSNNAVSWLSVSPVTGSTSGSGTLTVTANGANLSAGTYTGTITVTSPNASNSPLSINVTLTVTAGSIAATPTSLTFNQVVNGPAPASQNLSITSSPSGVSFSVAAATTTGGNWLSAAVVTSGSSTTSSNGTTPGTVQVTASAGTLATGQYTGTVTITAPGTTGSPLTIPVTLNVVASQTITVTPSGPVAFAYTIGAAAPSAQQLQVTSTGSTTFTAAAKTTDGASWLSVTPASGNLGTSPTALSVAVNPSGLAVGNYTGTVTITAANSPTPTVVNVTLAVTSVPTPSIIGIRNAASGFTGAISPGENITIFGTGIGPASLTTLQLTSAGKVSTNVGNTQVFFDGTAAPIIYASATQTSVMVPYEIGGRPTTQITVVFSGVSSTPLTYNVQAAVPGIYTQNLSGSGPGAILNQDFSVNGPSSPAAAGSIIQVFMTGEGTTQPQAITGGVAPTNGTGLQSPVLPVTATVGGTPVTVQYAGSAPGYVYGATQVNLILPANIASGLQPVVISIGGTPTQQGVTVQVK